MAPFILRPPSGTPGPSRRPGTSGTSGNGGIAMTSDCCLPAPPTAGAYAPDEIFIYGTRLNRTDAGGAIQVPHPSPAEKLTVRFQLFRQTGVDDKLYDDKHVFALSLGYAFEGHCYRFDRPRILLIIGDFFENEARGCGFDAMPSSAAGYRMWRVRSKTMILELNVNADFADAIVLESNLPGRRAPNTYEGQMQMAHRGGRLTNTG
jgi:hypothetical protein